MTNQPEQPTVSQVSRLAEIVLMIGTLVLAALLFSPFFSAILWAVVLSYALYPLYARVLHATGGARGAERISHVHGHDHRAPTPNTLHNAPRRAGSRRLGLLPGALSPAGRRPPGGEAGGDTL